MQQTRKKHSAAFKAKVALEALKGAPDTTHCSRAIAMPAPVAAALFQHMKRLLEERMVMGAAWKGSPSCRPCFSTKAARAQGHGGLERAWPLGAPVGGFSPTIPAGLAARLESSLCATGKLFCFLSEGIPFCFQLTTTS